jgi:hypothetical protein
MKTSRAVLLAALLPIPALAVTTTNPAGVQRHLVYAFTYGVSTDRQMHTSGMGGSSMDPTEGSNSSGMVHFNGGSSDKGTITVDVMHEQPDSGLVIVVSEQGQDTRKADPATCVVFSDTTIVCDPNKKINAEELTLLRFLGAHFVDPTNLDAKGHWHIERDGPTSTTADYTISKNANGAMTIDEVRVVKETSAQPLTTNINATIGYDFNKSVPTSVTEYLIQRSEQGEQYNTIKSETTLSLETDSMGTAKN